MIALRHIRSTLNISKKYSTQIPFIIGENDCRRNLYLSEIYVEQGKKIKPNDKIASLSYHDENNKIQQHVIKSKFYGHIVNIHHKIGDLLHPNSDLLSINYHGFLPTDVEDTFYEPREFIV